MLVLPAGEVILQDACQLVATLRRALVGATQTMCCPTRILLAASGTGSASLAHYWVGTVQTHYQSAGSKDD